MRASLHVETLIFILILWKKYNLAFHVNYMSATSYEMTCFHLWHFKTATKLL